ncbi:MAG: ACT domain-containing protein [Anaerolineales bacterium]
MEKIKIGGILCHENLTMLRIHGIVGKVDAGAVLLSEFGARKVNLQFIVQLIDQSGHDQLTLAVDQSDARLAFDIVVGLQHQIGAVSINLKLGVASLGIFGPDFRIRPGIAGNFLTCLNEQRIPIYAVSTSISTCSALIAESEVSKAKTALAARFILP